VRYPDGGAHRPIPKGGVWAHVVAEQICLKVQCVSIAVASLNSIADDLQ
jgi:hypothetical protein